jgi:hypothetical protein
MFAALERTRPRLLVWIPPALRAGTYRVSVRQVWDETAVGQVTWEIRPPP